MNLNQLLKNFRIQNNMTQEKLANKINVSHQTISKWEQGINTPSIDNLLILSDLYNISLDELIRGGNYLKKPFVMGKKISLRRVISLMIVWLFTSLLISGLWDQSFIITLLIFISGIILVLPIVIDNYWILEKKGIAIQTYPDSVTKKLKRIVQNLIKSDKGIDFIPYTDITTFELIYLKRDRYSPFDYSPDNFFTRITTRERTEYNLQVLPNVVPYLPQMLSYLDKKDILVLDDSNIVNAIIKKENVFDYMHK